jgi:hypothetical protein
MQVSSRAGQNLEQVQAQMQVQNQMQVRQLIIMN